MCREAAIKAYPPQPVSPMRKWNGVPSRKASRTTAKQAANNRTSPRDCRPSDALALKAKGLPFPLHHPWDRRQERSLGGLRGARNCPPSSRRLAQMLNFQRQPDRPVAQLRILRLRCPSWRSRFMSPGRQFALEPSDLRFRVGIPRSILFRIGSGLLDCLDRDYVDSSASLFDARTT